MRCPAALLATIPRRLTWVHRASGLYRCVAATDFSTSRVEAAPTMSNNVSGKPWRCPTERRLLEDELHARPAMYLPTARGPEIALPMKSGELYAYGPSSLFYSEWSGEYVFPTDDTMPRAVSSIWPRGLPHPIYLLRPGGAIRRVDMPYTDWNKGKLAAAVLTRLGVLVVSHSIGRNGRDRPRWSISDCPRKARAGVAWLCRPDRSVTERLQDCCERQPTLRS